MKNQEVITFAKGYSFKNDNGQIIQGGEIHIFGKHNTNENEGNFSTGHQAGILKVSYELAQKVSKKVPALYDVEYDTRVNRDNTVTLLPVDVTLVREIKLL